MIPPPELHNHLKSWGSQTILYAMCLKADSNDKLTDVKDHQYLMGETARSETDRLISNALKYGPEQQIIMKEFSRMIFEWCYNHMHN
jgi:hypothetical protein